MSNASLWWVLAGCAVGVELMVGTFYLLMFSIGLASAAIAAHLGFSTATQLVVAAVVGGGTVTLWRRYRQAQPASAPAQANRDVNLDIGELVEIDSWPTHGPAIAKYRGANWSATAPADYSVRETGTHRIVEVVGSQLVVRKA